MSLLSPMRLRILLPVVIVTLVLTGSLLFARAVAADRDQRFGLAQHETEVVAAETKIELMLVGMHAATRGVEKSFGRIDGSDASLCTEWLQADASAGTYLAVFDRRGAPICSTVEMGPDADRIIRTRPYFTTAISSRKEQFVGPIASEITGTWIFAVARPIVQEGVVVAVAVVAVDSQELLAPLIAAPDHHTHTIVVRTTGGSVVETEDGRAWRPADPTQLPANTTEGSRVWRDKVWSFVRLEGLQYPIYLSEPTGAVGPAFTATTPLLTGLTVTGVAIAAAAAALLEWGIIRRVRRLGRLLGIAQLPPLDFLTRDELDAIDERVGRGLARIDALQQEVATLEGGRKHWEEQALHSLNMAVEKRMPFLRNHGERVGLHAAALAAHLGFPQEEVERIRFAGQIHDIGKLTVRDAIYLKPAKLDPVEMREMQLHTVSGAELIQLLHPVGHEVAEVVRHHHERWDGTGYPDRMAGESIPLWARIVSIADSYDAMTEQRPYRVPRAADDALAEMKNGAGTQWDPALVEAFVDLLGGSGQVAPGTADFPRCAGPSRSVRGRT